MRILYFSNRECWPVNTGARLRDYHLAAQLGRHASVTYFGLSYPGDAAYPETNEGLAAPDTVFERMLIVPKARAYAPINVARGFIGPAPVTVLNCTTPAIAAALASAGPEQPFDSVQMEGVHLTNYLPVLRSFPRRPPIVCDWHNIESELMWRYSETIASLPRRMYARRTAALIEQMENKILRECEVHTTCSERERRKLLSRVPSAQVRVLENGVDTAYHSDDQMEHAYRRWREAGHDSGEYGRRDRIVYVGSMDYHANVDTAIYFARESWPQVRGLVPAARFTIVGRSPKPEVVALAGLPGIEVTGTVSDVRPYYREALAVVVPLRVGSGTRLKILEALAAGVPVVSTTLGAEGLDVRNGIDILIADTPADTSAAIRRLRDEPGLWRQLAAAGRELVLRQYDWKALGSRLFAMHEAVRRGPI